jgi:hypothetical protein
MKTKLILFVFIFTLSLFFTACQSDTIKPPEDKLSELAYVQSRFQNEQLIVLAVCKVFDGNGMVLKKMNQEINDSISWGVRYLLVFG